MSALAFYSITLQFSNGESADLTGVVHLPRKGEFVQAGKHQGVVSRVKHDYDIPKQTQIVFVYADIVHL